MDATQGKLLHRKRVVVMIDSVSPSNPVLKFGTMNIDTKNYPLRSIEDRYLQTYKPRTGFLIGGLAVSGLVIYTANSSFFHGSNIDRYTLDGGGLLLAAFSLLIRKPIGKPIPTGEIRLGEITGSIVRDDSIYDRNISDTSVTVNAFYKNRKMIDNLKVPVTGGVFQIDLSKSMKTDTISSADPGSLAVKIGYSNNQFEFQVPIKKIMTQYAVVKSVMAPLHSMPEDNDINVLADIPYHTRLRYVETQDSLWYKVLYGIAPSYLQTNDANVVWMIGGDGSDSNTNITAPYTGFGSVDVEQNIPKRIEKDENGYAIIIDNAFDTLGSGASKLVFKRDTRLMSQYLQKTLGYLPGHVKTFDTSERDSLISWVGLEGKNPGINAHANPDSTRLIVYYVGSDSSMEVNRKLLSLIDAVSNIKTASTAVLLDVYFGKNRTDTTGGQLDGLDFHYSLEHKIRENIVRNSNLLVVLSSSAGQNAGVYRSLPDHLDKMHSIFTYYYCQALKQGLSNWSAIDNYLERNVTFTSRSLLERPQDPVVFGNEQIPLIEYKKGN